jgi:hypothetical protein
VATGLSGDRRQSHHRAIDAESVIAAAFVAIEAAAVLQRQGGGHSGLAARAQRALAEFLTREPSGSCRLRLTAPCAPTVSCRPSGRRLELFGGRQLVLPGLPECSSMRDSVVQNLKLAVSKERGIPGV